MKIFIDTADIEEIKDVSSLGIVDGVTTNPSLMALQKLRNKEQIINHFHKISNVIYGDISVEVLALDFDNIIKEANELMAISPNIVVKIPAIKEGIKALKFLSEKGIKTNCTLIFSLEQALLAMKAGATYISPFVGRLDDNGIDGLATLERIVKIKNNYKFNSQIIAASVRNKYQFNRCLDFGVDVVTCNFSFINELFNNELTQRGLEKFISDFKNQ